MGISHFHLYGIMPSNYDPNPFIELTNLGFQIIQYEKIAAIAAEKEYASLVQTGKETLDRLQADQNKIFKSLMKAGFPLLIPMKLGTYSKNKTETLRILEKGYALCLKILEKISNMVEINVIANWTSFSQVMETVVIDPEVIELRQNLMSKGIRMSTADRTKIGTLIKNKLEEKGVRMRLQVIKSLGTYSKDVKLHQLTNDQMAANATFLVSKAEVSPFEAAIHELDKKLDGELSFKFSEPLPCYNFYVLEVVKLDFAQIELARNELGLQMQASAKEIKQAYLTKAKLAYPEMNSGNENKFDLNSIDDAYRAITNYMQAVKQSSANDLFCFTEKQVTENSVLVKKNSF